MRGMAIADGVHGIISEGKTEPSTGHVLQAFQVRTEWGSVNALHKQCE